MRCRGCGYDGEWVGTCPQCAASPPPLPSGGFVVAKAPAVGTFLWPSVATMLLCCLPFGALGMVFSLNARAKAKAGQWEAAQRAHRLSKVWFLCAVGAGLAALAVAAFLFAALGTREVPVGERERALCLRAQDLAAWGYDHPDPAPLETFTLARNRLDGSYELEYEFETPEGETERPLYIAVMTSVEAKTGDAILTQNAYKLGLMIGLGGHSVSSEPLEGLPDLGDESEAQKLTLQGQLVGVCYTARKGGRVYLVLVTGDWLADPELVGAEVAPRIEAFWDWQPEG